jgi:hypothetical protein
VGRRDKRREQVMGTAVGECVWCGQTVELAEDGAWQTVDGGSCGCSESVEQGGDGEHEVASGGEAA